MPLPLQIYGNTFSLKDAFPTIIFLSAPWKLSQQGGAGIQTASRGLYFFRNDRNRTIPNTIAMWNLSHLH